MLSRPFLLHEIQRRPLDPHLLQHDPARRQVEQVVAQLGDGEPGNEGRIGVEEPDVQEHDAGQQRAAGFADLRAAVDDIVQRRRSRAREQASPGARPGEPGQHAEEARQQAGEEPEHRAQRAADH